MRTSFDPIGYSLTAKIARVGAWSIFFIAPEFLFVVRKLKVIISSSFTLKFEITALLLLLLLYVLGFRLRLFPAPAPLRLEWLFKPSCGGGFEEREDGRSNGSSLGCLRVKAFRRMRSGTKGRLLALL